MPRGCQPFVGARLIAPWWRNELRTYDKNSESAGIFTVLIYPGIFCRGDPCDRPTMGEYKIRPTAYKIIVGRFYSPRLSGGKRRGGSRTARNRTRMKLTRQKFEHIVAQAMDNLPEEIADALSNVFVVVEQWPSDETIEKMNLQNRYQLLALYEGVPLTKRTTGYNALPDRITIFQGPIQAISGTESELKQQIRVAVVHEIAHHFGIGERRLRELGY